MRMIIRSAIAFAALQTLTAGCFLLPPDGEAGVGADTGSPSAIACQSWGDPCEGGYCLDVADPSICNRACKAIGDPCTTGACYYVQWQGGFFCMNPGAKKPGETCKYPNECASGFQCLERASAPTVQCYQSCGTTSECINGACIDTGLGFGACLEPSS